MKIKFKKYLSLLLAAIMFFGSSAIGITNISASAASGPCGENAMWSFNDATGELVISGTGNMWDWYTNTDIPWYESNSSIKTVVIENGITSIGHWAFLWCNNLTNVEIPASVANIDEYAFYGCTGLISINVDDENAYYSSDAYGVLFNKHKTELIQYPVGNVRTSYEIPNGVYELGPHAFNDCAYLQRVTIPETVIAICSNFEFSGSVSLTNIMVDSNNTQYSSDEYGVLFDKNKSKIIHYPAGNKKTSYKIPDGVTCIDYAFYKCIYLTDVTIPDSVTTINYGAFYGCEGLNYLHIPSSVISIGNDVLKETAAHLCSDTENSYAKTYAEENGLEFILCNGHGTIDIPNEADIYNLGEETYSFANFGDNDSSGGHCFGMSVTSSAYYTKELDIASVGGNYEQDVYALTRTDSVKTPICYYQGIQESTRDKSMVAGGHYYSTFQYNINSDWNEVVNYVKNHNYDNKGTLQIGFRKDVEGGHAINFLYYAEVDGQQRIYAYDNNFPNVETYFYMDSNGNVMQAPYSTFSGAIDCIALRSVPKYFDLLQGFDETRYIYADKDTISIEGSTVYALEGGVEMGERVMYEVPANVTQIKIKPLVDNAEFEYLDESYSFGAVDDDTVGVFTLATSDDQGLGSSPSFTIENEGKSIWELIVDFFKMIFGFILLPFTFLS